jgi:fermentation-respiration switch protein FrsA (DUF1100 family)
LIKKEYREMEFIRNFILEGKVEKKVIVIIVILFLLFTFLLCQEPEDLPRSDSQKLYLYFMGEEAGFEEYEWIEQEDRYILRVRGELTKPASLITELMLIEMDKEFKPLSFHFKGKVRGMEQEIESTISQGEVKNMIRAGGQKKEMTSKISSDALILPNSFFSPYLVLARKAAGLKEKMTFRAYVVPQMELNLTVEPDSDNSRLLHVNLVGVKIDVLTDEERFLEKVSVPGQMFEARAEKLGREEPSEKEEEGTQYELTVGGTKVGKGSYTLEETAEGILIKGKAQHAIGQQSFDFQFEEKLSPDWNFRQGVLKGKVNEEEVELKAEAVGDTIEVYAREGDKISEKRFPFSEDVIFSTENFLVDSLLLVGKCSLQQKKKLYSLAMPWGTYYFYGPLLVPVTVENEGTEKLEWKEGQLETAKYFVNYSGTTGGYIWADGDKVLKISFPFAAMEVFHQDFAGLKTRVISPPVTASDKYISEDVTFPSGEISMAGTLTIPEDGQAKHPAAVLISGSGPQDRNEDTVGPGGLKLGIFRQIAHILSENGVAVLRYDDRGTGKSGGSFVEAGQEDLIQDARAAVSYLRTRNDIRADRIALVGHSEGGIIAPRIAAEDPKISAIVLLAGTAKTGDEVLREQFGFLLDSMEIPDEQRKTAWVRYENLFKIIRDEPVDKEAEESLKPQVEPQLKWLRSFVDYDPLSVLDTIEAKVLIINGGKDKQVFPEHARMLYRKLKKLKKSVTLKIYPDLNHLLIPAETGAYAEYARQTMEGRRLSQKLLDYLSGWLHGVLFSGKQD